MKTKRIRTVWQRTPRSVRETVEAQNKAIDDHVTRIRQLQAEAQQLRADGRNLLVQRDEAQRALERLAGVKRIDVVITPPGNGLTTYFVPGMNTITPVFGVMPGDKILVARRRP